jgi:anti-anti-sigma factor
VSQPPRMRWRPVTPGYAVVDATLLADSVVQRVAYAHYEYLLDQQSSVLPLATICAYDLVQLGSAAVAEMTCLHPLTNRGASAFRLYADDGVAFALAGEVDYSSADQLADTLGRVLPLMSGSELIVDGRELEFIDHRGLLVLDRCAGQQGVRLALQTPRQTVTQIAEAIGLQHVRVDVLR